MNSSELEPTQDQLLAMAYVDGELTDEARAEFEARLASERHLRLEVAELKKLEVLARAQAPPEPMDHEWRQMEAEVVHGGGTRLGLVLLGFGSLGFGGWSTLEIFRSEMEPVAKVFFGTLVLGALVLFLVTLRGRLRTLAFDPYTKVER